MDIDLLEYIYEVNCLYLNIGCVRMAVRDLRSNRRNGIIPLAEINPRFNL